MASTQRVAVVWVLIVMASGGILGVEGRIKASAYADADCTFDRQIAGIDYYDGWASADGAAWGSDLDIGGNYIGWAQAMSENETKYAAWPLSTSAVAHADWYGRMGAGGIVKSEGAAHATAPGQPSESPVYPDKDVCTRDAPTRYHFPPIVISCILDGDLLFSGAASVYRDAGTSTYYLELANGLSVNSLGPTLNQFYITNEATLYSTAGAPSGSQLVGLGHVLLSPLACTAVVTPISVA
jgi:hypothetical protein